MGDKVTCPIRGHGVCTIVEGDSTFNIDGRPVALEGHKTSCGASLISTLPNVLRSPEGTGAASAGVGSTAGAVAGVAAFGMAKSDFSPTSQQSPEAFNDIYQLLDEKTGEPLVSFEYAICRSDGQMVYGITDSSGFTKKIGDTALAEDLSFSIGDW